MHECGRRATEEDPDLVNKVADNIGEFGELPDFFYEEALYPSEQVARFHAPEVRASIERWWAQHA